MKLLPLLSLASLIVFTGCHALGGLGYSAHVVKDYSADTGKLVRKETKRDLNKLGSTTVFTSKEASAFTHARTNLTGTASATSLGQVKSQPSPEAIEAGGKAIGGAVGTSVRTVITGD
jgi:hypothetical protein